MRRATGLIAGPESPPVMLASFGRRVSMSMAMPVMVLIREIESAPSASTLRAISVMSVTLGESLTIKGFSVLSLTALTTSDAESGYAPKAIPPDLTLGHEILTSIPDTSSISSRRAASSAYSAMFFP